MQINIIAAIGTDRELGKDNMLIWRIKADLQRVKKLTTGHPIIMGRKTYESIGHPLPERTNIVITTDPDYQAPGCLVVRSLNAAIREAEKVEDEECFIFGGAQIYALALPMTDRLYLTLINDVEPEADTFFPDYSDFSHEIERESRQENGLNFDWLTLERAQ